MLSVPQIPTSQQQISRALFPDGQKKRQESHLSCPRGQTRNTQYFSIIKSLRHNSSGAKVNLET